MGHSVGDAVRPAQLCINVPRFRSELNRRIRARRPNGRRDPRSSPRRLLGDHGRFFCSLLIFPVGEMLGRAVSRGAESGR